MTTNSDVDDFDSGSVLSELSKAPPESEIDSVSFHAP